MVAERVRPPLGFGCKPLIFDYASADSALRINV
jgi:hypothetical protein